MGANQQGWSLNNWGKSNSSSPGGGNDWPDSQENAGFNFDDKDKSQQRQESGCNSTSECGSGFACIGQYCVKVDGRNVTGGGNSNVGAGSNCEIINPVTEEPIDPGDPCGGPTGGSGGGSVGGCTVPGCGVPDLVGGSGDDGGSNSGGLTCCGGTTYRYCRSGGCVESCSPPPVPLDGCSSFCTNYYQANGSYGRNCGSGNTCSECQYCYDPSERDKPAYCRNKSNAPCYCPGGEQCEGQCETCDRDSGECKKDCNGCMDTCNCFVTCSCGKRITQNWSQPHCQSGLVCSSACREDLQKQCKDVCPDPPPDPCKGDPNEPCERQCNCVRLTINCGESFPPTPDGCSDTFLGYVSTCDGQAANSGLETSIRRRCCGDPPDACKCDGPNAKSCGECMTCIEGRCKKDPDCDEECRGPVCDGQCCGEGGSCDAQCSTTVVDACHGNGYTFSHPCSCKPRTSITATIPKKQAVCNRYHTHCSVSCGGASHLDCQAGLRSNGPTGKQVCA